MESVFFSGSISIKILPERIKDSISKIKEDKEFQILVGDAAGFDSLLQEYCNEIGFYNVTVYTIYGTPRHLLGKFRVEQVGVPVEVKSERRRQTFKDERMTLDSNISYIIWDEKSKGSYNNIIRAIRHNKKVRVFSTLMNQPINDTSESNINRIYIKSNGLTSGELLDMLYKNGIKNFEDVKQLNKYLIDNNYITKIDNSKPIYKTINESYSFDDFYKGKQSGVKFKVELAELLIDKLKIKSGYGSIRG